MKPDVKRIERGWAGHFICANRCLFRRNTLPECGNKTILVSTVGRMADVLAEREGRREFTEIGFNRFFETMAFEALWDGRYWDADVSKEGNFRVAMGDCRARRR